MPFFAKKICLRASAPKKTSKRSMGKAYKARPSAVEGRSQAIRQQA